MVKVLIYVNMLFIFSTPVSNPWQLETIFFCLQLDIKYNLFRTVISYCKKAVRLKQLQKCFFFLLFSDMSVEVKVKWDERNRDVSIFLMTQLNIIEMEVYTQGILKGEVSLYCGPPV